MCEKKKFIVTIEETISQSFEVVAEDDNEAIDIAIKKYDSGEFCLSPGSLVAKQMAVENVTDNLFTDWFEF